TGKTPEQVLVDLVVRHQRASVRESVGEQRGECFTDDDFATFTAAATPKRIAERPQKAPDFVEGANALRPLPADQPVGADRSARQVARPTWRQMGFVDRLGRGQTEAGHLAELQIAAAIVDAFAARAPAQ